MIASVSFVLTGNLICNFSQTGEISNFPLINMHKSNFPNVVVYITYNNSEINNVLITTWVI